MRFYTHAYEAQSIERARDIERRVRTFLAGLACGALVVLMIAGVL